MAKKEATFSLKMVSNYLALASVLDVKVSLAKGFTFCEPTVFSIWMSISDV